MEMIPTALGLRISSVAVAHAPYFAVRVELTPLELDAFV